MDQPPDRCVVKSYDYVSNGIFQQLGEVAEPVFGWTASDFEKALARRFSHTVDYVEWNDKFAGYILTRIFKAKYVRIDQLWVLPQYRGRGIGTLLLKSLYRSFSLWNRRLVFYAEVPSAWLEGQLFFRKHGYKWIKTKRLGTPEEYYIMARVVRCFN